MKALLLIVQIVLFFLIPVRDGSAQGVRDLPVLNWQVPADWIDITKEVVPKAIGNGKADDTKAIQAALDRLVENGYGRPPVTVYFPPGTYRITRTLHLKNKRGIMLVGAGRKTRIVWDGPSGGTMYWSDGVAYCRYVGMIWDGNKKAGTGHLHASNTLFETRINYEHMAFVDLEFGIRTGKDRKFATAESWYENCIFQNCATGIGLYNFNDYNHTVYGCLFKDCGYGVFTKHGTAYVLNSRFENSTEVDFMADGEHGQSMRRCVSVGSGGLLEHKGVGPLVVQDCYVTGWTNEWAIRLAGRAPAMVFDCRFSGKHADESAIHLSRGTKAIFSSNLNGKWLYEDFVLRSLVTEIPSEKAGGVVKSDKIRFIPDAVDVPSVIFDARKDFGAKGDGQTDDTASLRKMIAAAKKHGHGAMAYLPPGIYRVRDSIELSGKNYTVGGAVAHHTRIQWNGPKEGVVIRVNNPRDIVLQQISVDIPKAVASSVCAVRQENSGKGTRMTYDGVYVPGKYWKEEKRPRGFECVNPAKGATVHVKHLDGDMRFVDCARAAVLIRRSHDGELVIEGTKKQRDGFVGSIFRLSTISSGYAVSVLDNQSLVMSEFYHEQGVRHLLIEGGKGEPAGNVTIQGGKLHAADNPLIMIENYKGRLVYGPQQWYGFKNFVPEIRQTGKRAVDVVLVGNMKWDGPEPKMNLTANANGINARSDWEGETASNQGTNPMMEALDALRSLGKIDLALNFPQDRL